MIRLNQAIGGVILCTLTGGALGGPTGAAVGWIAPGFVGWLFSFGKLSPAKFRPVEFGLGLGAVTGLFVGIGVGVSLMTVLVIRDAILSYRTGMSVKNAVVVDDLGYARS